MNIFFDTEFTGLNKNATLISLSLISENGHSFYAEFNDYDENQVDDWIKENIIKKLFYGNNKRMHLDDCNKYTEIKNWTVKSNSEFIVKQLKLWLSMIDRGGDIFKFWGDFPVYDWILLTELFGGQK